MPQKNFPSKLVLKGREQREMRGDIRRCSEYAWDRDDGCPLELTIL